MYNNEKKTINNLSIENSEKLNNAVIFRENSKFSLAINCLEEMQGKNLENPIISYNMALTYYSYGNYHLKKNNYILAVNCYQKAILFFDDNQNNFLTDIYIKLAHCFQNMKDYENMKLSHESLIKLENKPLISYCFLLYSKLCCADFNGRDELLNNIKEGLKMGSATITPFTSINSPSLK